jgi:hypothetical protein
MPTLYRYEAKGLQSFILQTNKLREIKGGSLLIEELSRLCNLLLEEIQSEGGEVTTLSAAAGGASLLFEREEDAEQMKAFWPMLVERYAPGLQCIQFSVKVKSEQPDADDWKELQKGLQSQKNRWMGALPEAGPATFRAPRTGLPAVKYEHLPGGGRERMDRGLLRRFQKGSEGVKDSLGARLDPGQKWALNMSDDIGEGMVATIHIDGNDLGRRLQKIQEDYPTEVSARIQSFSEALSDVTLEAAKAGYKAALDLLEQQQNDAEKEMPDKFPGRLVVLGGDDITFLLRADLAPVFVESCLKAFEALSAQKSEPLLGVVTACAGVALTSVSFPFNLAHDLAEQLCKWSKNNLRQAREDGLTASGVSFHRVTTTLLGDFEELLDTELAAADGHACLTASPYTLEEQDGCLTLSELGKVAKSLNALPSGGVREVLSLLKVSSCEAAAERWDRMGTVLQDKKDSEEAKAWCSLVERDWAEGTVLGVRKTSSGGEEEVLRSALLDAWTWSRIQKGGAR